MKFRHLNLLLILIVSSVIISCVAGPKVIQSDTAKSSAAAENADPKSIPAFNDVPQVNNSASTEHKVVVEEVLNTDKYSYLNVTENGEKFWVAISKRDVTVGDTYYYKGGLLKKNFFSKEFNRVFETVYLVSQIWKKPTGAQGGSALDEALSNVHGGGHPKPNLEVDNIEHAEGSIKLSEHFANKAKYANQLIQITGKVVKVNPMIMNRNWLHIQDGSGEGLDLTVTTSEKVPLGAVVSLEGTIALDKDFGAGYRYDIIMEGAVLK
jgi:hypothetical protein